MDSPQTRISAQAFELGKISCILHTNSCIYCRKEGLHFPVLSQVVLSPAKARTEFNPFEVELGFGGTYFDADKINFVEVSADFILEFLGQVGRILAVAGSFGFTAQNVFKAADNILDFSADYIEFFLIFFGVK